MNFSIEKILLRLKEEKVLSDSQYTILADLSSHRLFSVYWEIQTQTQESMKAIIEKEAKINPPKKTPDEGDTPKFDVI